MPNQSHYSIVYIDFKLYLSHHYIIVSYIIHIIINTSCKQRFRTLFYAYLILHKAHVLSQFPNTKTELYNLNALPNYKCINAFLSTMVGEMNNNVTDDKSQLIHQLRWMKQNKDLAVILYHHLSAITHPFGILRLQPPTFLVFLLCKSASQCWNAA